MPVIIACTSQKGGVGKSSLARLVACEYARADWKVKIADLDISQGTSFNWQARRLQHEVEPVVAVERFGGVDQALKEAPNVDLLILDCPPHSNAATLRAAQASDAVLLPTGLSLDDLQPTVLLAHELVKKGVRIAKIAFALCRVGDSPAEIAEARKYITQAGYRALSGSIPEKTAYRRASDSGRSLKETRFPSLNERSDELLQSVVNFTRKLERAA